MDKNYTRLTDEELEVPLEADEPGALYEKGRRLLDENRLATARKFLTLGSILGDRNAHIALAKICEEEDNFEEAYDLYVLALVKGANEVLPRVARLLMRTDAELAIEILKTNAADGNLECLRELVAILTEKGDARELKIWEPKLAAAEKAEAADAESETEADAESEKSGD
jgi:hypothetical protein